MRKINRLNISAAVFLISASAHADPSALQFSLASENVSDDARPRLEAFLDEARSKLPPQYLSALPREVEIHFVTSLDHSTQLLNPCSTVTGDSSDAVQVLGMTRPGFFSGKKWIRRIDVNALLIPEILKGPDASTHFACGHGSFYATALATILHETSHVYDFAKIVDSETQSAITDCQIEHFNTGGYRLSDKCNYFLHRSNSISDDRVFMNLGGWVTQGAIFVHNTQSNTAPTRSPDEYEFTNPQENFAVNMEYFLLDPEYACRRPTMYHYLQKQLSFTPFVNPGCTLNTHIKLSVINMTGTASLDAQLDPSRIYQIQYLLAGKGANFSSHWGHAMYRIIVCSPDRKAVGPDCLNDVAYHLVLSYRANVQDLVVSSWKGLVGDYASRPFLFSFMEIKNEYTIDEMRELDAIPLNLSDDERQVFIERILEQNWEYSGRYFFLGNNCATEALNFLKGIIDTEPFQDSNVFSPIGLMSDLEDLKIGDASVLDDQNSARIQGYLYDSVRAKLDISFKAIQSIDPTQTPKTLDDYIATPAQQRASLYANALALLNPPSAALPLNFFVLESYIAYLRQAQYYQRIASSQITLSAKKPTELSADETQFLANMKLLNTVNTPTSLKGYGNALESDFPAAIAQDPTAGTALAQTAKAVFAWADQTFEAQDGLPSEIKNSNASILYYLREQRRLRTSSAPVVNQTPNQP